MTVIFPEATKAQGNISVTIVTTIADTDAPSLATEINAGTSVNVSCFLVGDFAVTATTNKGEAPRRNCTTQVLQQFGNTTYEVADLQYIYDPQAGATDENEAKDALVEGTEVYMVERLGMLAGGDSAVAYAAGQRVNVYKIKLGPQNRTKTGDGEFDELTITQSAILVSPPVYDVQIVA